MMQVNTYITFDGSCEEAFTRYQQILGGRITIMMRHAGTPAAAHVPAEWQDKIMHACLDLGGGLLMASDAPPDRFKQPQGFSVQIAVEAVGEAERVFAALAEHGSVGMPLQQTFWAERFGMLVDRFGVPWMLNCILPAATASGTGAGGSERAA